METSNQTVITLISDYSSSQSLCFLMFTCLQQPLEDCKMLSRYIYFLKQRFMKKVLDDLFHVVGLLHIYSNTYVSTYGG
jgi:hypothetical protein